MHDEKTDTDPTLRQIDSAHTEECLNLSSLAGWNQTASDWRLMLSSGDAFGLFVNDHTKRSKDAGSAHREKLIATAICLPYPPNIAWISMVLVHKDWRRRGFASRLMDRCLKRIGERGLSPILDATDAGRSVYEGYGFVAGNSISRFEADARAIESLGQNMSAARSVHGGTVAAITKNDLVALRTWDLARFGGDRSHVLNHLFETTPVLGAIARDSDSQICGFALGRPGRIATQIGPVVAETEALARALIEHAILHTSGPVILDIPDLHEATRVWLLSNGFVRKRGFVRMARGIPQMVGDMNACFAIGGPELG